MMPDRLARTVGRPHGIAEIGVKRSVARIERQRLAVMGDGGVDPAGEAQRDAEIVVQFGVVGLGSQQTQIAGDGLVETAGTVRGGGEPQLLRKAVRGALEQRARFHGRAIHRRFGAIEIQTIPHARAPSRAPSGPFCNVLQ